MVVLRQRHTPPEEVRAHPAAAFPGSIPAENRTVAVDTGTPRWHSTGLYAAPGELVTVTMPASVAAAGGYQVRVGATVFGCGPIGPGCLKSPVASPSPQQ